jgi:hypothetical protein
MTSIKKNALMKELDSINNEMKIRIENFEKKLNIQILENSNETNDHQRLLAIAIIQYDRFINHLSKIKISPSIPIPIKNKYDNTCNSYNININNQSNQSNQDYLNSIPFTIKNNHNIWILFSYSEYSKSVKESILKSAKSLARNVRLQNNFININNVIEDRELNKREVRIEVNNNNNRNRSHSYEIRKMAKNIREMEMEINELSNNLEKLRNKNNILSTSPSCSLNIRINDNIDVMNLITNIRKNILELETKKAFLQSKKYDILMEKRKVERENTDKRLLEIHKKRNNIIQFPIIYSNKTNFEIFIKKMTVQHQNHLQQIINQTKNSITEYNSKLELLGKKFKDCDNYRYNLLNNMEYKRLIDYYQKKINTIERKIKSID